MSLGVLLLVLAVVAFILGFTGIGQWLFIIAAVLLVVGLVLGFTSGWSRRY